MAMARATGLNKIRKAIEAFAARSGNPFHYWTPSPLLVDLCTSEEITS